MTSSPFSEWKSPLRRWSLAHAAAVVAAVVSLLAACSGEKPQASTPAAVARVEVVRMTAIPDRRIVAGSVRSESVAPLAARVPGSVLRVLVVEGDRVRRGQPLVEIDARDARAGTARAAAGSDETEAAIRGAEAALSAAQSNADLSAATLERYSALRQRGSVSPQEFDEVSARKRAADAQLTQAERNRDALTARRAESRAGVTEAATLLSYSTLLSPFDGIVTARLVDPGAQASPGVPLLTVEDDSRHRIDASVDESLAARIRIGDTVSIEGGGQAIRATVARIDPTLDAATRSAIVRIAIPSGPSWRSGTFVRVGFTVGARQGIVVPGASIVRRGALTSVFVVSPDGLASMRLVTLGEEQADGVEILSGLEDGETIVVSPGSLRDGTRVSPQRSVVDKGLSTSADVMNVADLFTTEDTEDPCRERRPDLVFSASSAPGLAHEVPKPESGRGTA